MISVWKFWARPTSACIIHWTSTTMASTAPVKMANSCCKKLPAAGMPWRIRISLAVQQIPDRFTPLAPAALAYSIISGSCEAATIISLRVGSCPCTTTLTMSSFKTPRFACPRIGAGVPNRISETSVAIKLPPHPSVIEVRIAWCKRCSTS